MLNNTTTSILEDLKLIGETLKVYIVIISIFMAGWWTYNTFITVHYDEINRKPKLSADIKATPLAHDNNKYIKAIVTVKNNGNDSIWLDLGVNSFGVTKVDFDKNSKEKFTHVIKTTYKAYLDNAMLILGNVKELEISPNSEFKFSYVANLTPNAKGLFYVSFLGSQRHEEIKKSMKEKGYSKNIVLSLQASDYIYLK